MSIATDSNTELRTLYVALLNWHFDRKNNTDLRAVIEEHLSSSLAESQQTLLSDASLSPAAFHNLAQHCYDSANSNSALKQEAPANRATNSDARAADPVFAASKTPLAGLPVAEAIFSPMDDELANSTVSASEPERSGIDWVATFYGFDGLVNRFSFGWLSIGRVLALSCVAAVFAMPFYLEQEQPVTWEQIGQIFGGDKRVRPRTANTPTQSPLNSNTASVTKSAAYASSTDFLSTTQASEAAVVDTPAEESASVEPPPSDIAVASNTEPNADTSGDESAADWQDTEAHSVDHTPESAQASEVNALSTPVNQTTSENDNLPPPQQSGASIESLHQESALKFVTEGGPVIEALSEGQNYREIIELVEAGELRQALTALNARMQSDADEPGLASLIEIEALFRLPSQAARERIWQLISSEPITGNRELYELQVTRWLMGSSRKERSNILLHRNFASHELGEQIQLWTEARSGTRESSTVAELRRQIAANPNAVCDKIFLANVFFVSKQEKPALKELIECKQLLEDMEPTYRSYATAWLVANARKDLLGRIIPPLRRVAESLGEE